MVNGDTYTLTTNILIAHDAGFQKIGGVCRDDYENLYNSVSSEVPKCLPICTTFYDNSPSYTSILCSTEPCQMACTVGGGGICGDGVVDSG